MAPAEKPAQPVSAAPSAAQADDLPALTPEEFAAIAAYAAACQLPTPNADGVHVGDIFFDIWGYEQTNVDFYQVVGLKGRHTAVIRRIGGTHEYDGDMCGHTSPRRDCFISDELHTVRTKATGSGPEIGDPRGGRGKLNRTTDFKTYFFSNWG